METPLTIEDTLFLRFQVEILRTHNAELKTQNQALSAQCAYLAQHIESYEDEIDQIKNALGAKLEYWDVLEH